MLIIVWSVDIAFGCFGAIHRGEGEMAAPFDRRVSHTGTRCSFPVPLVCYELRLFIYLSSNLERESGIKRVRS